MVKKQHVSSLLKENKWYNKVSYIPSGGFIDTTEIFLTPFMDVDQRVFVK